MNVLFVCSANLNRSPAAVRFLKERVDKEGWKDVEIVSAGTQAKYVTAESLKNRGLKSVNQLTDEMLGVADVVFAFDSEIENEIKDEYSVVPKRMFNLGIRDHKDIFYTLDGILEQKLETFIEEVNSEQKRKINKEIC